MVMAYFKALAKFRRSTVGLAYITYMACSALWIAKICVAGKGDFGSSAREHTLC